MKIAIIGSGISGMTCAHLLQKNDITLFEANDCLGGHTHTATVEVAEKTYKIDTGFIVFNDRTYPNFEKLMTKSGVSWKDTEMSFSVSNRQSGLEYNGHNLNTLFAQRDNFFNPRFYGFINEILYFNKRAKKFSIQEAENHTLTLGQFIDQLNLSEFFKDHYLLPMVAAIWSCSLHDAKQFPLTFFLRFFLNHGLLNVKDRPQWRVIEGGSSAYIPKLLKGLDDKILLSTPVESVTRKDQGATIKSSRGEEHFDHVIFACHSDQALKLLSDPSDLEEEVLGDLDYQANDVVLHIDASTMPNNKRAWASWNFAIKEPNQTRESPANVTYYMNRLQGLPEDGSYPDFFVSLNKTSQIDPEKILKTYTYDHPVVTQKSITAQKRWSEISGVGCTHFCGAYWFSGFHEDGVKSALQVCESLGETL